MASMILRFSASAGLDVITGELVAHPTETGVCDTFLLPNDALGFHDPSMV